MILHDTTAAIIEKNGKILLVKRGNQPNKGYWGIPGGHVDDGETVWEAVNREMKEEVGNVKLRRKPLFNFINKNTTGLRPVGRRTSS